MLVVPFFKGGEAVVEVFEHLVDEVDDFGVHSG